MRPRSVTPRPTRPSTRTLYVGGFAADTSPDDIRALFAHHGDIVEPIHKKTPFLSTAVRELRLQRGDRDASRRSGDR